MMYTDGLIEGRVGANETQRLGQDGMVAMINRQLAEGLTGEALLEAAVAEVRELNGGELTDDVAVLLLDRDRSGNRGRSRSTSLPRPRPGSAPSPANAQRPPL
jgi:hypothetical protein